jgi:hypothetical protein
LKSSGRRAVVLPAVSFARPRERPQGALLYETTKRIYSHLLEKEHDLRESSYYTYKEGPPRGCTTSTNIRGGLRRDNKL